MQGGLPRRPGAGVDVGRAELEQRLDDVAAAVLDGVVDGERVVEVEAFAMTISLTSSMSAASRARRMRRILWSRSAAEDAALMGR